MKKGIGHAHGKIILIGEHAVVYKTRAIAIPYNKTKVVTKVYESNKPNIISDLFTGDISNATGEIYSTVSLIEKLTKEFNLEPLTYEIISNIPISSGMGSSAAIASSIVEAVFDYLKLSLSNETRLKWIAYSEEIAHGNPSGIDALTTTFDNTWLFKKYEVPTKISINLKGYLIVSETDILGKTKEAVSLVRKVVEDENKMYLIDEIGSQVELCYQGLTNNNIEMVANAMNIAQRCLKELHVSTNTIDEMVNIALNNQALAAKLTGGGLGGCVIAITDTLDKANLVKESWEKYINKTSWILNFEDL
ncbi:MAG: mevalonate kinase [Bacilli bacterium]